MSLRSYLKEHPDYQQYDDKTLTEALYKKYGKTGESYTDFARTIEASGATDDSISNEDLDLEDNQVKAGKAFIAARNTPDQTFTDKHGNTYSGDVGEPGLAQAANESLKQNIKTNYQLQKQASINEPKPEYSFKRFGGQFKEGYKDVARSVSTGTLGIASLSGRIKAYHLEERERLHRTHGLSTMTPGETADVALLVTEASKQKGSQLTEQEVSNIRLKYRRENNDKYLTIIDDSMKYVQDRLKADPNYFQSAGWWEDLVRMGPQVGGQILVGMATGFAGSAAFMGLHIAGATYEGLISKGVSPDRAMTSGIANAMMQAPLEAIGISKLTNFFKLKGVIVNRFKEIGKIMGTEWLTEFLQAHPETLTDIWGQGKDSTALEMLNEYTSRFLDTIKQGAYEGSVAMFFGGVGGAIKIGTQIIRPMPQEGGNIEDELNKIIDGSDLLKEDKAKSKLIIAEAKEILDPVDVDEMLGAEQVKVDEALDTKEKTGKEKLTTAQTRDIKVPDIKQITDPTKLDAIITSYNKMDSAKMKKNDKARLGAALHQRAVIVAEDIGFLLNQPRNLLIMR